jgi:hypothetical protein
LNLVTRSHTSTFTILLMVRWMQADFLRTSLLSLK